MSWLELYRYSVSENGFPNDRDQLLKVLDVHERERFARFKFDKLRWTFATARWVLKSQLARHLEREPEALSFTYNPCGKPMLEAYPQLQFSLSHTEKTIAVAISDKALGLDIESLERRGQPWQSAEAFLNERLGQLVAAQVNEQAKKACFARYWTAMEARVKIEGSSLFRIKDSFGARLPALEHDGHVTDGEFQFYSADAGGGEQLSLCTVHKPSMARAYRYKCEAVLSDTEIIEKLELT